MVGGECWDEGGEFGIIRIMKNLIPLIAFGAMMLPAAARLPVLSDPVYADTEVSTNVAFNPVRSDARQFGISMDFSGTPSNCVQIAFGRDADSDGDLSADETRLVLGWRGAIMGIRGLQILSVIMIKDLSWMQMEHLVLERWDVWLNVKPMTLSG